MQNRVLILLLVLLSACSEDALVPCSSEAFNGKLCRKYQYYNDQPQGFTEYEYQGDSVVTGNVYSTDSELQKSIITRYRNGQLSIITEQFPNSNSRVETWHYNEMDSLSFIVYGANDSSLIVKYDDGKRFQQIRIAGNDTLGYSEYRYYQDDGMLYRITEFDKNDSLLSYRNFDYFDGNDGTFYRATYYTSEHELIGRRRFSFSQNGLISSMEYRLADGTLAESKEYIYNSAERLTEESGQRYDNTSKSVYLYN